MPALPLQAPMVESELEEFGFQWRVRGDNPWRPWCKVILLK